MLYEFTKTNGTKVIVPEHRIREIKRVQDGVIQVRLTRDGQASPTFNVAIDIDKFVGKCLGLGALVATSPKEATHA